MPSRRFLTPGARAGSTGHGYNTQPQRPLPQVADEPEITDRIRDAANMCDEPEAISAAIVDAYADLARTYDRIRHEAEVERMNVIRQALDLEQRMAEAHRRAKRQHINVSHEMRIVQQLVERAQRGNRTTPPEAIRRIERIEAKLDYRPDLAA